MQSGAQLITQDARKLGDYLAVLVSDGQVKAAERLLSPVLAERTPFRLLDVIGTQIGCKPLDTVNIFLDHIAAQQSMGGWVVIASALRQQTSRDLPGTLERCRRNVILADVWYATDIFGERVPGPALVGHFEPALALLMPWREDPNRWVRRITGVSIHYWAKQARGDEGCITQASALLDFMVPMFEEREVDVIKGVGWGLKTLGKYYPELTADWLEQQVSRPHRALMLRKATTYFPARLQHRVREEA